MIELAGFRYAASPRVARWARVLLRLVELSYATYLIHAALLVGGWPYEIATLAFYLFLIHYSAVITVAYLLFLALNDVDKQRIVQAAQIADGHRVRIWWRTSAEAALLRSTPIWLGATVFGALACLPLVARHVGEAAYGAAVCVVAILMASHIRAGRVATHRMTETAALGDGELYWLFDWDRFDCSAEDRFRARFVSNRHWKVPSLITHPAEADRYADRARQHRLIYMALTAASTLTAIVFAQRALSDTLLGMWHDITHLMDAPHRPEPGIAFLCSLAAAIVLFFLPVCFQYRASEMDSLAKLYDERGTSLLND